MGVNGQPSTRVATFNNASLQNDLYNTQGRRYALSQAFPIGDAISASASLYIPSDWVTAGPNSTACLNNPGCIRAVEFKVEFGYAGGSSTITPVLNSRMGFDNRLANASSNGPYLYLMLDGPATQAPTWPYSALGTKLQFCLPSSFAAVPGWEGNILNLDGWNQFTVTAGLWNTDWAVNPTFRNCSQTLMVNW